MKISEVDKMLKFVAVDYWTKERERKMMEQVEGGFWTRESELINDFAQSGFEVSYIDYEAMYIIDENDNTYEVGLVRAGATIAIKYWKEV